ncbi:MAG: alanine--tRNA ligase, partial [Hyphomonadaceae bacterium]|nr:alanine--tRNA ligase [Hyphomonadaceae bacterium]
SPDADGDRFVEIWNLVFMQFEQHADGRRERLPKPCIDTGAGLERVGAVMQGVHSNYDTDLFRTLIAASEALTATHARGATAASHRVIADHLRASCFLLADGVSPSAEGRGYVLRRIMRRAMRHAHMLGAREPLLHRLAPTLIAEMGSAYPELVRAQALIAAELEQEETRFRRTLERGLALLEEEAGRLAAGGALSGETAFKLYDTYGFPLDLTQDILRGRGQSVDAEGFQSAMSRQREMGREAWVGSGEKATDQLWLALRDRIGDTRFAGYDGDEGPGRLLAIIAGGAEQTRLEAGQPAELVFDATPFYAESGGQNGDTGAIRFDAGAVFQVEDVQKRAGGLHVHVGRLEVGAVSPGDHARLSIDAARRSRIRANHSAVHLLHAALRRVLGPHVSQKGQLVDGERLRFDFAHGAPLTPEQLERIEHEVNAVIRQNEAAATEEMTPAAAVAAGAVALFGEKYGERVRVLALGRSLAEAGRAYSVELCGGTHVARTGDIAVFTILAESGVAGGVRRIEGATGEAALAHLRAQAGLVKALAGQLKSPVEDLLGRVGALAEDRRRLERELAEARKRLALAGGGDGPARPAPEMVAGVRLLAQQLQGVPAKDLRGLVDEAKRELGSGVAAFLSIEDGKAALAVGVTGDLTAKLSAVELVKAGVAMLGGQGGGGRPDMAQGGGPNAAAAAEALGAVQAALRVALNG